jgi:peptide deformylase
MILDIKKWPEQVLRTRCQEWDFNNPPAGLNRFLSTDLLETLHHYQAHGIAANQVGVSYRVIAINIREIYHTETLEDMDAKCFLHELDHLNGIVFKEYVSDLKFNMAVKKGKKI